ncbi:MAG TPA: hypothetical protein VIG24_13895 [Acidimicrobiia bacterium]
MSERHPPYWFFHEYLDEAGRMRVHKHTAETEPEARKMHRQACEFRWVTQHVNPSVSSLFRSGDRNDVPIGPGSRPGQPYGGERKAIPMPDYIRRMLTGLEMGDEAALSGVRAADDRNPVLAPPSPLRHGTEPDQEPRSFGTPF